MLLERVEEAAILCFFFVSSPFYFCKTQLVTWKRKAKKTSPVAIPSYLITHTSQASKQQQKTHVRCGFFSSCLRCGRRFSSRLGSKQARKERGEKRVRRKDGHQSWWKKKTKSNVLSFIIISADGCLKSIKFCRRIRYMTSFLCARVCELRLLCADTAPILRKSWKIDVPNFVPERPRAKFSLVHNHFLSRLFRQWETGKFAKIGHVHLVFSIFFLKNSRCFCAQQ